MAADLKAVIIYGERVCYLCPEGKGRTRIDQPERVAERLFKAIDDKEREFTLCDFTLTLHELRVISYPCAAATLNSKNRSFSYTSLEPGALLALHYRTADSDTALWQFAQLAKR